MWHTGWEEIAFAKLCWDSGHLVQSCDDWKYDTVKINNAIGILKTELMSEDVFYNVVILSIPKLEHNMYGTKTRPYEPEMPDQVMVMQLSERPAWFQQSWKDLKKYFKFLDMKGLRCFGTSVESFFLLFSFKVSQFDCDKCIGFCLVRLHS